MTAMADCDKTPELSGEGYGLEARANHNEMRALAESQVRSNTLIACLISQPQVDRQREFVNENGFCNRISGKR